jgi:multidrug efflux pump subunit AcrB
MDGPDNTVFLKDIGHADDSYAIQTSRVHVNGHREVYVPIYRQQGASSLVVAKDVEAALKKMEKVLPEGTKLDFIMNQSVYVEEAIHSLIHEGVIGAVLVAVMILVFLGNTRMTLIASMSIPLAICCALIGLYYTGNTINAMTLGGLALAIGPLVDDAIVVLENTHRHHSLGKSKLKAAFDGAVEVTIPVLVATATTIIVLCPIALMSGMGGFLFRPLTLAVAFAMISSFVLSRTFVPMLCAKWLGGDAHQVGRIGNPSHEGVARWHAPIERGLNWLTRRYEGLLDKALRHRRLVLGAVALLFLGSLTLVLGIGQEFFPQVDAGQITIYARAPSTYRLDAAERRFTALEHFLEKQIPADERKMIVTEIGLDPDWSAAYTANSGQQDAVVRVQLSDHRSLSAQEYAIKLRRAINNNPAFADLRVSFDTGGMISAALNYGASSPIDIEVRGAKKAAEGMAFAKEIRRQIIGDPENGMAPVRGAADTRILQRLDAPYLFIKVDRQRAASLELSAEDVIYQVVAALNSSVSINRNFWIDLKSGNQYFVAVQYEENPGMLLENVLNVVATGTKQPNPVKLSSLVTVERDNGAVEVNHTSLYQTLNVLVNTENRDIAGVARDIEKRLKNLKVPKGLDWKLRGEYERMNRSFSKLSWGLAFAALLVYLLMVPLFRSYLGPFIIMFTVPLGLIGVLTMLFVTRTTLNVQSEMGVIFLVGIVVSNGVLLVDFANKQRQLGASVRQAITTAAAIRFRPIMMTFLATFLDLVPMAIGMGRGSEANVPLARAVVGGLLTSTCLTLFVVPILFTLLMREQKPEPDIDTELADQPVHGLRPVLTGAGVVDGVHETNHAEAWTENGGHPRGITASGSEA